MCSVVSRMFSGAVKIGDVSDFIAPSQDCIVSLGNGKATVSSSAADGDDDQVREDRGAEAGHVYFFLQEYMM